MPIDVDVRAIAHALGFYQDPGPGDLLFDERNAAAVTATTTEANILSVTLERRGGILLGGFATSPTGLDVTYRVLVNGEEVIKVAQQPTEGLYTLYPLRIIYRRGPVLVQVRGITASGSVTDCYARVAGWYLSGDSLNVQRLERG